jgi:hypothetical protein
MEAQFVHPHTVIRQSRWVAKKEFFMKRPTLSGEFAKFDAKLVNPRWACSAIAAHGSMVLSGWSHLLKWLADGHCSYEDNLARWRGNRNGNKLLHKHLSQSLAGNLSVHLVVATADDPNAVISGEDASLLPKTFSAREELVGRVRMFDGNAFIIDFEEA